MSQGRKKRNVFEHENRHHGVEVTVGSRCLSEAPQGSAGLWGGTHLLDSPRDPDVEKARSTTDEAVRH